MKSIDSMLIIHKNIVNLMLPSCVPATPFEHTGANLDAKTTQKLARAIDKLFSGISSVIVEPAAI